MKQKTMSKIGLIMSILLSLGVMTFFRACAAKEDGTWMHCHYVQMNVFYLGLAMAVLNLAAILFGTRTVKAAVNLATGIVAVVTALLPGTIMSMCMMKTMRCYAVMRPFVTALCILILAFSLRAAYIGLRQKQD